MMLKVGEGKDRHAEVPGTSTAAPKASTSKLTD